LPSGAWKQPLLLASSWFFYRVTGRAPLARLPGERSSLHSTSSRSHSLALALSVSSLANVIEDGFDGLLLLVAAFFVVTMIVWMKSRCAASEKDIEQKGESYSVRALAAPLCFDLSVCVLDGRAGRRRVALIYALSHVHGRFADRERDHAWALPRRGCGVCFFFKWHPSRSVAPIWYLAFYPIAIFMSVILVIFLCPGCSTRTQRDGPKTHTTQRTQ